MVGGVCVCVCGGVCGGVCFSWNACVPPDALQKSLDFFYQDYPIYYFLYVISRAMPVKIAIPRSSIRRICQFILGRIIMLCSGRVKIK